jgi:signal peptidase II
MTVGRVFSLKLRHFGIGLLGSSLVLLLDQASKSFMIELLSNPPHVIPISSFFNLALGFNRGVSFGLLNDLGTWGPIVLSSLAVVIVGFLLVWLWNAERAIDGAAISLSIGGALGNLLDRFIGVYHWPAFNLADTGIFTGAALLVIQSFRTSKKTIQDCAEDGSIE